MSAEAKLIELKLRLPEAPQPMGSYVSYLASEPFAFLSGVLPKDSGKIVYQGKLGTDLSLGEGQAAARLCALNAMSVIRQQLGSLDAVQQIVRVVGFIASHPEFCQQPAVLNGASDLFKEVFGDKGVHSRSAVGAAVLPANAACEIEVTLRV